MIRKLTVATAAVALMAAGPAGARSAPVAQPAEEQVAGANALAGEGMRTYVLAAIALGLAIWGIIELSGGGDDDPVSP
jgi:hypothetical protein